MGEKERVCMGTSALIVFFSWALTSSPRLPSEIEGFLFSVSGESLQSRLYDREDGPLMPGGLRLSTVWGVLQALQTLTRFPNELNCLLVSLLR